MVGAGSGNNIIGGTTPDTRNVISGAGAGVDIASTTSSGNAVEGNQVGTDPSGTSAVANFDGVVDGGVDTLIGGTTLDQRNVLSGNERSGVIEGGINSALEGNYIGINAQGDAPLPNDFGVLAAGGVGDVIGGPSPGDANIIGGLYGSGYGIEIDDSGAPSGTNNYVVQDNFFGTDPTGMYNFGNDYGIVIEGNAVTQGVADTTVTGNVIDNEFLAGVGIFGIAAKHNVIEGNMIGLDSKGTTVHANGAGVEIAQGAFNNTVGGTSAGAGNVISGNTGDGVLITDSGTTGNVVEGNYVGTEVTGTQPLGNVTGVVIAGGAVDNTIGGATAAARNVISGNSDEGVIIQDSGTTGNVVEGNYVGTDVTGSVPLANFEDGVVLSLDGGGNTVGGTTAATANVLSGNVRSGVAFGLSGSDDVVEGNLIGVNAQDNATLTNGSFGILANGGNAEVIGGTAPGAGNVIGGLSGDGIEIDDSGAPAGTNNYVIEGNFFGTDPTCTLNFGNAYGILVEGNAVTQGVANTAIIGNVIENEYLAGVEIYGIAAHNTVVQGNFIGTDPTGTRAGPNGNGVAVVGGAYNNTVDATAAGAPNIIEFNTGAGVVVGASITDSGTIDNTIRGNSIYKNGGLGIDLGDDGVTHNHTHSPSSGPNNLQNFPELSGARALRGGHTQVTGTLHSIPNKTFTLDFYASASPNPSGCGEGQHYLGHVTVTTNAHGIASFNVQLSAATTAGQVVSATATDAAGNTSEFSADKTIVSSGSLPTPPSQVPMIRSATSVFISSMWGLWDANITSVEGDSRSRGRRR